MSSNLKAALWMLGAVISFSAMAISGREINFALDTFEIMMYRSLIGVFLVLLCASFFGTRQEIKARRMGLHFWRNIGHFAGQNLWFYAVTVIPFTQLFAFEFSVPLLVAIAAPFALGERLTKLRFAAICVGFVGILLVTRPWSAPVTPGLIAAALCAVGFAISAILTKQLTRTESITSILFWLTLMQLGFGLICAGFDGDIAWPSAQTLPFVIIIAIGGLVAHFSITKALTLADATIVTPVDFIRLPLIAFIGMQFYGEPIDIWVITGAIIIFAANYTNIWADTRKKRVAGVA